MIVLDNYTTVDEKILIDPSSFSVKIVDDSHPEEAIGVGGFAEDVFLGVYAKNDLLHFCYDGKIYSADLDNIKCTNDPVSKDYRHFKLSFSGSVICDIRYQRNLSPISAFGDDEEEFDFLLYLSSILKSKDSIDRFMKSVG
jgi:hypothetical protein